MLVPTTVPLHPSSKINPSPAMITLLALLPPIAAVGYSIIYLLLGGGVFGAVVIFIVAKIFGK